MRKIKLCCVKVLNPARNMKKTFFIFILLFSLSFISHSQPYIADRGLSIPVQLQINNMQGSGFFLKDNDKVYLISAAHVIIDINEYIKTQRVKLFDSTLIVKYYSTNPYDCSLSFLKMNLSKIYSKNQLWIYLEKDIIALCVGTIENDTVLSLDSEIAIKRNPENIKLPIILESEKAMLDELNIGQELFIIGYPSSVGLRNNNQIDYSKPLVRKGIISGFNKSNNSIVIDGASYQGNSGGPILIYKNKKTKVIGILTQLVPYEEKWINTNYSIVNTEWSNSGYSIVSSMDDIIKLLKEIK
jgi:hypothetical protein